MNAWKLGLACLAALVGMVPTAQAYSVRVHIHLANQIRDDLISNWDTTGAPVIRLLAPAGTPDQFVRVSIQDAEAIRDNPEYFRAGSIGPDNTVFPGLTDPSHAWPFSPFSQCQALLDNSENPQERAYALGCFIHGIGDNNAHHLVNYFSGETFTLYPVDAAAGGQLQWSLLNVVRHMTVESQFEEAIGTAYPNDYTPERLTHSIPIDLYRRVYLDPNDGGRGLWHWFAGQLVQQKNDALRAARLTGFDPNGQLSMTIEEIRASGVTVDLDGRVTDAYLEFLRTGGGVAILNPGEGLTPADYVLLLPEIVEDLKRLLAIADVRGQARMAEAIADWKSMGECSVFCPLVRMKKGLFVHIFEPDGMADGMSRFQRAVARKNTELSAITAAYVESVERLSNLIVVQGFAHLTPADVTYALQPLNIAIGAVTAFPYAELFPVWAVAVLDHVAGLRAFLEGLINLVVQGFIDEIMVRLETYLNDLIADLTALLPDVVVHIRQQVDDYLAQLRAQLDAAKLQQLGLEGAALDDLVATFPTSVLYMNTFNSCAGAMANQEVIFNTAPSSFFASPVSFDASYQVTYNQMSLCDSLRPAFYPCGTSAAELLQPDYTRCEPLPASAQLDPPIECHRFSATAFASMPDAESCNRQSLAEIVAPTGGHIGSYSLAHPPEHNSRPPTCFEPGIRGINADGAFDLAPGSGADAGGCACRIGPRSAAPWAWLALIGLTVAVRKRRRSPRQEDTSPGCKPGDGSGRGGA